MRVDGLGSGRARPAPRFRHAGLTPQLEYWDACVGAWTSFMASIDAFAKTGTGAPFGAVLAASR